MAADNAPLHLACIGLGALGTPMALNLVRAGHRLTVFNRDSRRCRPLAEAGAQVASSAAEAAAAAEQLLLCVSDDAAVEAVLLHGEQAAAAGLRRGALVIDCSTIAPATSRKMAQTLAQQGVDYVDAPVTGGTEGAKRGTLSVLVGGERAHVEQARTVLEVIGTSITHFGAVGSGQEAKAVNQVLVAGSYAAVAEALNLAQRLGLNRQQVVTALKGGAAGSWALEHRSEAMINDAYPLGFRLALHRKDLGIALEAAAAQQLELPVSKLVATIEDQLIQDGLGDLDVSALARWFRN